MDYQSFLSLLDKLHDDSFIRDKPLSDVEGSRIVEIFQLKRDPEIIYNDLRELVKLFIDSQNKDWLSQKDEIYKFSILIQHFYHSFVRGGFVSLAESILIYIWQSLSEIQSELSFKIYKAAFAHYLSTFYLQSGDTGAALRWALLAHADDKLENREGGGRQLLLATYGISRSTIESFNRIILDKSTGNGWNLPSGFAEDSVLELYMKDSEIPFLASLPSAMRQYPPTFGYFSSLIDQIEQDKDGKLLERIAAYLTTLVPMWMPKQRVFEANQTGETDIVVTNFDNANGMYLDLFGRL